MNDADRKVLKKELDDLEEALCDGMGEAIPLPEYKFDPDTGEPVLDFSRQPFRHRGLPVFREWRERLKI